MTNILNKEYSKYVNDPDVVLEIEDYRPIKVYIGGEIENPGMYVLKDSSSPSLESEDFKSTENNVIDDKITTTEMNNNNKFVNIYFPSIFDLIRKSGGLSMYSDLSNVEVTRVNTITNGGGRIKTKVDLFKTLNLEDNSQNLRLYDGDTIFLSKTDKPIISQMSKAIQSNINPKYIKVTVTGRVIDGGRKELNKTASLVDAIKVSGGVETLKGQVRFVRFNTDGTYDHRRFKYNRLAKRGSYQNPFLQEGDYISVDRGSFKSSAVLIKELTEPLNGVVQTILLYRFLNPE